VIPKYRNAKETAGLRTAVSIATACLLEHLRLSFAFHDLRGVSYAWTSIKDSRSFWFFRTLTAADAINSLRNWNSFIAARLTSNF
jgi:hypothetical protein